MGLIHKNLKQHFKRLKITLKILNSHDFWGTGDDNNNRSSKTVRNEKNNVKNKPKIGSV